MTTVRLPATICRARSRLSPVRHARARIAMRSCGSSRRARRADRHPLSDPHPSAGGLQDLGYSRGRFPVTERLSEEIVSLPMYPELGAGQLQTVADAVAEFLSG